MPGSLINAMGLGYYRRYVQAFVKHDLWQVEGGHVHRANLYRRRYPEAFVKVSPCQGGDGRVQLSYLGVSGKHLVNRFFNMVHGDHQCGRFSIDLTNG